MTIFKNRTISAFIFTSLLVFAVFFTLKFTNVGAQSNPDSHRYLYYTSVEVQPGDTLTSIAKEFITPEFASVNEYVKEIKEYNNLGSDTIHAGNYISVMYYSDEYKQ